MRSDRSPGLLLLLAIVLLGAALQFSAVARRADAIPVARVGPPAPPAAAATSAPGADDRPASGDATAKTDPAPVESAIDEIPAVPARSPAARMTQRKTEPDDRGAAPTLSSWVPDSGPALEKPRVARQAPEKPIVRPVTAPPADDAAPRTRAARAPTVTAGAAYATKRATAEEPSPAAGEVVAPAQADEPPEPPTDESKAAAGPARLVLSGPSRTSAGQQVVVTVSVDAATRISHAPLRLRYDPAVLEFVSAREGKFMSAGGAQTVFMASPSSTPGLMFIAISRMPPADGADGSGELCTLTFLAKAAGETAIDADGSRLLDRAARSIEMQRSDTHVVVQ